MMRYVSKLEDDFNILWLLQKTRDLPLSLYGSKLVLVLLSSRNHTAFGYTTYLLHDRFGINETEFHYFQPIRLQTCLLQRIKIAEVVLQQKLSIGKYYGAYLLAVLC